MKQLFFFFAMLASVAASAAVTVTPLATDYAGKKVTFRVAWTGNAANNRVWVWVNLCPVAGTSPGTFAKAVISNPSATAGSIATVTGNTRGFYVTTNPSTVTATLSNATGKFNWCVYGSDAPPKVTANNGTYTLYGTPPFTLIAANGTTTQTVAATTIATSAVTITPVTLTDQTGYPAVFCIYTGSDLFIDGTHLCQQRATGAQNWEAWIKDTRDSELYRIVFMPDNKWWLAQNVKYNGSGYQPTWCGKDQCGRVYTATEMRNGESSTGNITGICPSGWLVPVNADMTSLSNAVTSAGKNGRALSSRSHDADYDHWAWQDEINVYSGTGGVCECKGDDERKASKMTNNCSCNARGLYVMGDDATFCGTFSPCPGAPVRCHRQQ